MFQSKMNVNCKYFIQPANWHSLFRPLSCFSVFACLKSLRKLLSASLKAILLFLTCFIIIFDFSSVIWLDIVYVDSMKKRVTVCGHQSGILTVSITDVQTLGSVYKIS